MKLIPTLALLLTLSGCATIGNYAERRDAAKVHKQTMADPCGQNQCACPKTPGCGHE